MPSGSSLRFTLSFLLCASPVVMSLGCSKPAEPAASAAAAAAPASPASATSATSATGRIVGKTAAPNPGASIVVVLESRTPRQFPEQTEQPVMDQVGQTFGPELLIVRTGQPVEFRNSDDTLHNVHVSHEETREPAFNVAIPTGASYTHTFPRDGFYRVGCDIHPAMAASVFAASTPYATLTDRDGRFAFADVPAGAWTITVYSAGRKLQRDVEVHGGATQVTIE